MPGQTPEKPKPDKPKPQADLREDPKNPNRVSPGAPVIGLFDAVPIEKVLTLMFGTEVVHDDRGRLVCPRHPAN